LITHNLGRVFDNKKKRARFEEELSSGRKGVDQRKGKNRRGGSSTLEESPWKEKESGQDYEGREDSRGLRRGRGRRGGERHRSFSKSRRKKNREENEIDSDRDNKLPSEGGKKESYSLRVKDRKEGRRGEEVVLLSDSGGIKNRQKKVPPSGWGETIQSGVQIEKRGLLIRGRPRRIKEKGAQSSRDPKKIKNEKGMKNALRRTNRGEILPWSQKRGHEGGKGGPRGEILWAKGGPLRALKKRKERRMKTYRKRGINLPEKEGASEKKRGRQKKKKQSPPKKAIIKGRSEGVRGKKEGNEIVREVLTDSEEKKKDLPTIRRK